MESWASKILGVVLARVEDWEPVLHVDRGVGVYDGIEYVEGNHTFLFHTKMAMF